MADQSCLMRKDSELYETKRKERKGKEIKVKERK